MEARVRRSHARRFRGHVTCCVVVMGTGDTAAASLQRQNGCVVGGCGQRRAVGRDVVILSSFHYRPDKHVRRPTTDRTTSSSHVTSQMVRQSCSVRHFCDLVVCGFEICRFPPHANQIFCASVSRACTCSREKFLLSNSVEFAISSDGFINRFCDKHK